ncbi:MAG TPA: EamA family transporter [Streptosporangiaceae bacterium]|jgi:drug/metabolite transporter (DMT)-like permease
MPVAALALALMSAVSSGVWNMLLKRADDTQAASAVALAFGVVLFGPALALGRIPLAAWPWIGASAACEFAYFALLVMAYERAELSLVFPLARGLAPVLVLLTGLLALHVRASPGELAGIALVAVGAVAVRGIRGIRVAGGLADAGLAVLIAGCIAGYTLIDKHGVSLASPAPYFEAVLALVALPYLALVARATGVRALRGEVRLRTVGISVCLVGGYDLVLAALRLAAAAPVAAVRESSVVIGTGLAAFVLHERVGPGRWLGACLLTAGVMVLALAAG